MLGHRLPPDEGNPVRLLAVSGDAVRSVSRAAMEAIEGHFTPDLILPIEPSPQQVMAHVGPAVDTPVLPPHGIQVQSHVAPDSGLVVLASPNLDVLPASPAETLDAEDLSDTPAGERQRWQIALVTDAVSLTLDPHNRQSYLEGIEEYVGTLGSDWFNDQVLHLSTALRPGYEATANAAGETVRLVGIGQSQARLGAATDEDSQTLSSAGVYANGAVDAGVVDPSDFGLQGLTDVGASRARALESNGHETVADLADVSARDLADISEFGDNTATAVHARARARSERKPIPLEDDTLPDGQPIYIDIETDGLTPSTAWLVGVLDGGPEDGDYLAFRQRDPADPRSHLEGFLTWLTGAQASRPVVAYNGLDFDFPVLRQLIQEHCPEYLDAWESTYTFDPFYWAVKQGNMALPGRTNQLEDVATALGWESATQGIDGATVADLWTAWETAALEAEDPASVSAPDWERLEAYCEDDVRALATIYEALEEAVRVESVATPPTGSDATQGSLSDFI